MSIKNSIRDSILERLYLFMFNEEREANIEQIMNDYGTSNREFDNVLDRLVDDGLIIAWTAGNNYRITSYGVLDAEERDIPPDDLVSKNRNIRTKSLVLMAKLYEDEGKYGDISIEKISQNTSYTAKEISDNLDFLEGLVYIEHVASTLYKITYDGLDAVEEYKNKIQLSEEFQRIRALNPQMRGINFQTLVSDIFQENGWESEVSLRTDHEEMDVVFSKGREYFLVECKWENQPVGSGIVREFFGKLSNRTGISGVLISMSGFTSGSIKQTIKFASNKIILLFGPEDISKLVNEAHSFDEMLNMKYKAFVTKNEIEYS